MIDKTQLRTLIVEPVLRKLDLYSPVAVNLLLGTAAQESRMGTYIKQLGTGPALGIYQMEPATHKDLWQNYLRFQQPLAKKVEAYSLMDQHWNDPAEEMIGNLYYATAMARVHYRRVKSALPTDPNDLAAIARYWKKFYNTVLGAGTEAEFIANYKKYVA